MSIYREIESDDKVFGRVRTVSSGLFGDGFELINFYWGRLKGGPLRLPFSPP